MMFNATIQSIDHLPKQNITAALKGFCEMRLGMFLSYGMTTFTSDDRYSVNYLLDPPPPSTFAAPSTVDSAQWATEAANAGCDYAVLTTCHHIGFNIFPFTGSYNKRSIENTYDSNRGELPVPVYPRYDVSMTSADQNIIGKFIDQCVVEGINPCLYYNAGKNINVRRGLDLIDAAYDQTGTYSLTYQNYIDYTIQDIVWICKEYPGLYALWIDAPHHFPKYKGNDRYRRKHFQEIYNAVKRHSPNTLVLFNYDCATISSTRYLLPNGTDSSRPPFSWSGDELMIFPGDIPSFEYFRVPSNVSDLNPVNGHDGKTYFMPKEVISTILTGGQYFARNDNFNSLESLATIQGKFDYCKANNIPLLLNVAVAKNGVIPANQITRFNELT